MRTKRTIKREIKQCVDDHMVLMNNREMFESDDQYYAAIKPIADVRSKLEAELRVLYPSLPDEVNAVIKKYTN